jgi:hypothetical protein
MTRKSRALWTLAALLLVASAALAEAGPRARTPAATPPPVATYYLTPTEQFCQMQGRYTLTLARARDDGVSRFTALTIVRRVHASSAMSAADLALYEAIIALAYDFPRLTPVWLQQEVERRCLTPPQTDMTYRY